MEVAYTITLEDYLTFNLHLLRRSKVARASFLANWLLPPLFCLVIATLMLLDDFPVGAGICAAVALLCAAVYPRFHRWWVARHARAFAKKVGTRGIIGPIRLILNDVSLTEITESTRTEIKWRDVAGIEEVGDYTFILVTGLSAAILPRHGFEREDDYFKVRDFARARIGGGA